MERLGYGWDALHERYPERIYAAVSGFGHTGRYRERPAYDLVVQAMGGIMSLTGQPGACERWRWDRTNRTRVRTGGAARLCAAAEPERGGEACLAVTGCHVAHSDGWGGGGLPPYRRTALPPFATARLSQPRLSRSGNTDAFIEREIGAVGYRNE